ncbi:MAG: hypothetical protein QM813_09130 [Verrucomicrobiota bacterium]
MRAKIILTLLAGWLCTTGKATAILVNPFADIVQNGNFAAGFANWSGSLVALVNNPNAPTGRFLLAENAYQDLTTVPGQEYSLSFYAAADLYFGSSLTLNVNLNSQSLLSFSTPPYPYDPQTHRASQMRWEQYNATFTATATTTRLEFMDLNTYDFGLAKVSVVPVPEPTIAGLVALSTALWLRRSHGASPRQ